MTTTRLGVALVTGASSGIGKATAIALKSAGFITYATARNPQTLNELAAKGCHILQLDITDEASMLAAVRSIEAKYGAVSVLVNNAGYNQIGPLEELTMEEGVGNDSRKNGPFTNFPRILIAETRILSFWCRNFDGKVAIFESLI